MKKLFKISLVVTLLSGLFWGCEKKETPTLPTLPPIASMSMDFSNFNSTNKSGIIAGEVKEAVIPGKGNLILASTIAGVWNIILTVNLVVPVESFKQTANTIPVYRDNNTWEWSNNFNVIGANYKSRLTGQIRSNDVKWEMYITREGIGAFSEIMWFEGTSKLDGKSGQWILNHSQIFPEPMLQIDWVAVGQGVGNIKYTYIRDKKDDRSSDLFKTSFIEYGLTTKALDAFYNIHHNAGTVNVFNDVFIEWSTTNHNGHIKANYSYQDDLWHCWNEAGDNIICN